MGRVNDYYIGIAEDVLSFVDHYDIVDVYGNFPDNEEDFETEAFNATFLMLMENPEYIRDFLFDLIDDYGEINTDDDRLKRLVSTYEAVSSLCERRN